MTQTVDDLDWWAACAALMVALRGMPFEQQRTLVIAYLDEPSHHLPRVTAQDSAEDCMAALRRDIFRGMLSVLATGELAGDEQITGPH